MSNIMSPTAVEMRLDKLLQEKGLTQRKLAKMSGLSAQSISKLTGKPRQIKLETLGMLIDALDVDLCDLFEVKET